MDDLEFRVNKLEQELSRYKAAAEEQRRGQVFQHLVEKWRLSEDFEPMLELATEKINADDAVSFTSMVEEATTLFKQFCKRANKEFVEPGAEFQSYIAKKKAQEEQERKDAESLKALMR